MNLSFGVPSQRKIKEEKYPTTPVLTFDIDEGKGKAKRMILNAFATEKIGLNDKSSGNIVFLFDDSDKDDIKCFLGDGDQKGVPDEYKVRVSKIVPKRVSDKRTYEYMAKVFNLDTSIENDLVLGQATMMLGDITLFPIQTMESLVVSNTVDSEEDDLDFEVSDDGILNNESSFGEEVSADEFSGNDFGDEVKETIK